MSANEVLITARKPNCVSAHGACSRELPQPKLSPASRIWRACDPRLVQDEIRLRIALRIIAPVVEQLLVQPCLEVVFRNRAGMIWSVSMLIHGQRHHPAFETGERLHSSVLTSVTTPVMALAAAVSGLARNVRPPLPCRPSKLRLLVETLYSPGCKLVAVHGDAHRAARLAPFAAGGAENLGQPFGVACAFHLLRAGHHHHAHVRAHLAALEQRRRRSRRSEIRELVQLPMNTTSTGWPSSGLPPSRSMYCSAFASESRSSGSAICAGSGSARVDRQCPCPGWCRR